MTNGVLWRSRLLSDYWFSQLPAGLQDSLLDAARQVRKTPGKSLIEKGASPCGLYVLLEGNVRVGDAHEQRLVPRLEPVRLPYWFGEVSLFDGLPRRLDVVSLDQTIFLHVPQPVLVELLDRQPAYWRSFAGLLSQKLGLPILSPEKLDQLPDRPWVAWRLLMLCEGYGHLSHARRLITLDELQSPRNLASAVLLEVLKDLHERKIVRLDDGQVEVFDVDKLRKVANFSKAKAVCQ
ncbi:Crp/Fnr family transcriptional regulator [Pseudomonas triticifolii]|uniref:Cyclic nucleotide-binding domain-containing protein n=1 Tax=Pseudomonas triticifolii TaxID=2762592 RepID=A0ABR7BL93_9PSED|nr:cyclic nucleotide-binding domain-containing protein [Pseudomonas triticifolii]MBC3957954.1 cyclic nucleotide-binding domain-containing protein [Pseudomonas triticifolii]